VVVAQIPRGEKMPTRNAEAYALCAKGTEMMRQPAGEPAPLEEAQHFFERAIALDPRYALAHARLSRVHSLLYANFSPEAAHKQRAKSEADEALRLDPNLGDAHLALGTYLSRIERKYDMALKEFDLAKAASPNDPYVHHGRGHALMRRGKFQEAIADYERATELDPMNWNMFDALGNAYLAMHMYSAAEHAKKRSFELVDKKLPLARWNQEESWGAAYFLLTGSFEKIDDLLSRPLDEGDVLSNANTLIYMGKIRDGQRIGRGLYIAKHRGSACDERVVEYGIETGGLMISSEGRRDDEKR